MKLKELKQIQYDFDEFGINNINDYITYKEAVESTEAGTLLLKCNYIKLLSDPITAMDIFSVIRRYPGLTADSVIDSINNLPVDSMVAAERKIYTLLTTEFPEYFKGIN